MDDIRRPERRDYTLPSHRPHAHHPHPQHHQSQPPPQPIDHPPQPAPAYDHNPYSAHHQPAPIHHPAHNPAAPKKFRLKSSLLAAIILAAAAIFGAGYLLRGSSTPNTIPAAVSRQANFNLYFPSPMPAGYTYIKDTATFQIGDVFYKFGDGLKRVTVKEEPIGQNKPNLSLLAGYQQFDSPAGKAAIGTTIGEASAVVVTPTTVITMNTVGGVSPQDLKTAINDLKNIGQKPKSNT